MGCSAIMLSIEVSVFTICVRKNKSAARKFHTPQAGVSLNFRVL